MKNVRRFVAMALISVVAVSASGCKMIAKTPEGIAKSTVAKVGSEKITRGELDERMTSVITQLKAQYGNNYMSNDDAKTQLKQQKDQMLDNMIDEKVLLDQAKSKKLVPSDADLKKQEDAKYAEIKKGYKTDADFNKALSDAGFTEARLKTSLGSQIIIQKLVDELTKNVKITDKDIEDYYNKNQVQFTTQPNKIHLAHILVATKDEADKVETRLKNGEDFAKVAKEVSTDTGSKDNGGDLGEVDESNTGFVQEFSDAALKLKEGEISAPVQTQYGFHVIKCIKKTEYPVKKLDEVKDQIKQTLKDQQTQKIYTDQLAKWKKDVKITKYEENVM
ncbi:MAG: peptidylprolyl isomerase [Bacillota bacterium]|nr:peptidylprolyl isomerase [Bacillota bacterium]